MANTTITPLVGSATLTGQAPGIVVGIVRSPSAGALTLTGQAPGVTTNRPQLGLSVGSPSSVGGIECYQGLVHWRAGMGIGGIDAILYTGPS